MSKYESQLGMMQRLAIEKDVPVEAVNQYYANCLIWATQSYSNGTGEWKQYKAEQWTWNKFFCTEVAFPGKDPLYDTYVSLRDRLERRDNELREQDKIIASLKMEKMHLKRQLDLAGDEIHSLEKQVSSKMRTIYQRGQTIAANQNTIMKLKSQLRDRGDVISFQDENKRIYQDKLENTIQRNNWKSNAVVKLNEPAFKMGQILDTTEAKSPQGDVLVDTGYRSRGHTGNWAGRKRGPGKIQPFEEVRKRAKREESGLPQGEEISQDLVGPLLDRLS